MNVDDEMLSLLKSAAKAGQSFLDPTTTLALVAEVERLREYLEANEQHAADALSDEQIFGPAPLRHLALSVVERRRLRLAPPATEKEG